MPFTAPSQVRSPLAESAVNSGGGLPAMIAISPGSFMMGADGENDKFASGLEMPLHAVTIARPFLMGTSPVTFDEWDLYAAETGAHHANDRLLGRGRHPVVDVSWNDAMGYVGWLSTRTGKNYRLPTEAEWEYCCRAGTSDIFSTGSQISVEQANYLYTDFREKPGLGRPVAVGSYPPNKFGLSDMHGNVCQLVADAWHDDYRGAPTDGSARNAPDPSSAWRVVRGAGWDAMTRLLRCAFRDWIHRDQRFDNTGFRVACDGA
jgi:formylglycine-generating enzyme required for sulfatase activity